MTVALPEVPASPYRGLAAFDDTELDALFFFGRERETEVIAANLIASRFTVLYGPTGVGKSSVLRAGVVRRLRALAPDAAVVVFDTWAGDAAGELLRGVAAALGAESPDGPLADGLEELVGRAGGELYLVLDQFEELFVYAGVEELVAAIAEVVTRPGLRVHVLLSLRDDALSELDVFTGRIQNVFGNYLALERLERVSARAAVLGPLERFNELSDGPPVEIEGELVESVLDQVEAEAQPGSVEAPYLQLVLERLWAAEETRGSRVLRCATLDELGGAQAIVRAHLGEAVDALTPPERDVAARVLNHLVTPSGTKIAHDAGDLAEYAGVRETELRPVLASLGRSRILRPVDGRFEIYHDVLADPVVAWRLRHEGERELERERAEAERRHRRLLALLVGSLVVLGVMVAVTVYALTQRSDARRQADVARTEASRAQASRLAAEAGVLLPVAQAELDSELALALAAEATRQSPTARAVNALRRALLLSLLRTVPPEEGVTSASFSPDGRSFAVGTEDGAAAIYSVDGGSKEATLPVGSTVLSVAYGPGGRQVLTTERDGPATLWDAASGAEGRTFGTTPEAAALSPDGTLVLAVEDGTASLWQAADGSLAHELRQAEPVRAAAFGPGGDLIVTVAPGGVVRVFDVETGAQAAAVAHGGEAADAEIAPDGARLVTAGEDGIARVWSLPQGRLLHELKGHRAPLTSVAVSPDGSLVATTSADATARTWDAATGELVAELAGHVGRVDGAAFSHDSQSLATWGAGRTVRVGDPRSPVARAFLAGHGDGVTGASFDASGDLVLTTGKDGRARLWRSAVDAGLEPIASVPTPLSAAQFGGDGSAVALAGPAAVEVLETAGGGEVGSVPSPAAGAVAVGSGGELLAVAEPGRVSVVRAGAEEPFALVETEGTATALALSLDDRLLAVGGEGGTIAVQAPDGGRVAELAGPEAAVSALAFDPDAGRLAAGFADGTLAAWSLADGRGLYELPEHERARPVTSVAFSPDGGRLATAGGDAVARVRDAATGAVVYELRGHSGTVQSASFGPTGEWIVTSATASAALWDTSTRQRLLLLPGVGRLLASSFDASGLAVLAVGSDGTLGRYACEVCASVGELLSLADRRIAATGRTLTPQERRHYLDEG